MVMDTLSGVVIIALFVQLMKSFYEAAGLCQTNPWHDPLIWATAFLSGILGYDLIVSITAPITGQSLVDAAGKGLLAAWSAIGSYHLVTHSYFDVSNTTVTSQTTPVEIVQVPTSLTEK